MRPPSGSTDALPKGVYSPEAEHAVLGALLLDNNVYDLVADILRPEDFHDTKHQHIYQAIQRQVQEGKPFDPVTLSDRLDTELPLLVELARETPSTANAAAYADMVHNAAIRRQVIAIADQLRQQATGSDTTTEALIDDASRALLEIGKETTSGPVSIRKCLIAAVERIDMLSKQDNPVTGVPTGFDDLDKKTAGLQSSDLIIVAGRPSMGKTTLAMNFAENAVIHHKIPVLVFSLEQPKEQLTTRMFSSLGQIDHERIRNGKLDDEDWPRLTSAVKRLDVAPLFIDDTPALTVHQVRTRARRMLRQHGIGLIVVDYLQLMRGEGQNRVQEVSQISAGLKALAKELRVPVVALAQLSRAPASRTNQRPVMSDLRDSGSIEQDADVIFFIYRDEVYNEDSPHKGIAEINIGKQRNGPTGTVHLTFRGQFTRFDNHTDPIPELAPAIEEYCGGFQYSG